MELLEAIGRRRGMLISGGEVNTERAAIMVVDEFVPANGEEFLWNNPLQKVRKKPMKPELYEFDRKLTETWGTICGVDEAGRGPLCGPVAVAAVILDPQAPILGVDDSKKLSEKKREASTNRLWKKHSMCLWYWYSQRKLTS